MNTRLPVFDGSYRLGLSITLLQNDIEVTDLPPASNIVLSFPISDEEQEMEFAIYFWDGTQWVELEGVTKATERVEVMTINIGTFVLVKK